MEEAYIAVGRAIVAAQVLETALVPIVELHRLNAEPGRLSETRGLISAGAFKAPVKNLVKLLSERGSIAPDLEDRLNAYIEDRHLLVHRWVQQNPLPSDKYPETLVPLMEHARKVEREAEDLARLFVGYVLKYAEPEWSAQNPDEYRLRMVNLFHSVCRPSE